MSREVCMHGVELYGSRMCVNCIEDGRNEHLRIRRSDWIKTNIAGLSAVVAEEPDAWTNERIVMWAESLADELIKRGHL